MSDLPFSGFFEQFGLAGEMRPFHEGGSRNEALGWYLYLIEDVSYVSERLSDRLEVLWHPDERRVVGFKLWDAETRVSELSAPQPKEPSE